MINQILESAGAIEKRKGIKLNVFAIANSKSVLLNKDGVSPNWRNEIQTNGTSYTIDDVIAFANEHHLENLIAIDNSASAVFASRSYLRPIAVAAPWWTAPWRAVDSIR